MTTQEIAIKYGVPMPETCKELDWKQETIMRWAVCQYTGRVLIYARRLNTFGSVVYFGLDGEFAHNYYYFVFAPQMHEIAPLLPSKLILPTEYGNAPHELRISTWNLSQFLIGYCSQGTTRMCCISHPNHYAESYAQMYIKLKSENLL